jgi:hypothetical protein
VRALPLLLLLGCSSGPPPAETRSFPPTTPPAAPAAYAASLKGALEAAGWVVERAGPEGLATRRREEPEDFAWTLQVVLTPKGEGTTADASLTLERSSGFRPVEAIFRNNTRMQADDEFLETKNRPAYEKDQATIDAGTPEGRREAAIRRLEGRIRGILGVPPPGK